MGGAVPPVIKLWRDEQGMRRFVILGHTAAIDPDFTLNDLPGSAGRLDVLCRCINSALLLSHGIREDTEVFLVLQDTYTIRISGEHVQYLNPDERSTGALLKKALEKKEVKDVTTEQESTPGIYIQERGTESLLRELAETGTIIQLHEEGSPVSEAQLPENPVFVLSDHNDFWGEEAELLSELGGLRVSLGPERLHADHAITVAQNALDTDGFTRY